MEGAFFGLLNFHVCLKTKENYINKKKKKKRHMLNILFWKQNQNFGCWLLIVMGEKMIQLHSNTTSAICIDLPPYINSNGLWVKFNDPQWWLKNSLPLLELQLILFCFCFAITYHLLKRFGVSKFSCQILVSIKQLPNNFLFSYAKRFSWRCESKYSNQAIPKTLADIAQYKRFYRYSKV